MDEALGEPDDLATMHPEEWHVELRWQWLMPIFPSEHTFTSREDCAAKEALCDSRELSVIDLKRDRVA